MKQAEKMYLISDAARQVQVETHVLRYWEEELSLPIKRNELGHRYYTEEDIKKFKEIHNLKEQGLQLKAIKSLLNRTNPEGMKRHVVMVNKGEFMPVQEESKEAKSLRLQQLLQNMIAEAVRNSHREIGEEIKESLLKELDYQFRLQEEREEEREGMRLDRQEEHYRKIDELIRSHNKRGFDKKEKKEKLSGIEKTIERGKGQKGQLDEDLETEQSKVLLNKKNSFPFLMRKKRSIN